MSEFVFEFNEEEAVAEENKGSGGALSTGIYKVKDIVASLGKTGNGNNTVDLAFTTEDGRKGLIYMAFMTDKKWASGSENFNLGLWNQFIAVTGMKTGETAKFTPQKDDGTNLQKDGKDVVLNVFKEVHGIGLTLAIKKVLSVYNGEVQEKNEIHSVYDINGKSYSEKVGNLPAEKCDKVAERLKDKHDKTYKAYLANGGSSAPAEEESTGGLLD